MGLGLTVGDPRGPPQRVLDSALKPLSRYERSDRVVRRAGGPSELFGRPPATLGEQRCALRSDIHE